MMAGRTLVFSRAAFTEAWNDPNLSRYDIALRFDMSNMHTWRVARRFDLPPRKKGPRHKALPDQFIRAAWLAGVSAGEICREAGIVEDTLYVRLDDLGLKRRGPGARPKMTLADFRVMYLRAAMAVSAQEEQAALRLAEMVDGRHNGGGRRAA